MPTPTRFLILSDTHNQWPYSPQTPAPPIDVFIHCGDLTQVGGLPSFHRAISTIQTIDAELKLVIAGNHDLELDEAWVLRNMEDEEELQECIDSVALFQAQKEHGINYLDEGRHAFTFASRARFTVCASPYTLEFNGYAFAYGAGEDRFNEGPYIVPDDVDIVITHGPPALAGFANFRLDVNREGQHCGCPKLARAIQRAKPPLHCFGHVHEGTWAGARRGSRGLMRAWVVRS
ncbi:Metallo-dependent phosphatase-like protein [Massariosphaeria phaeospora]|uniref:Metallo-dependent phosphatase-like protein n=1 Tax=Massariosphaeria phaeospora TaxID=100035 RepID=A0A7C8IAI9_9PLEO|nr:Metallo-dependent phosphatase-like protein [Massariosphaeria phaeospora]